MNEKTALEQFEYWIEEYYRINGAPTLEDIKGQLNLLKDYEREQLNKHVVKCEFHCERFDFGRDKKCEQQCSDCHWMQTKSQ